MLGSQIELPLSGTFQYRILSTPRMSTLLAIIYFRLHLLLRRMESLRSITLELGHRRVDSVYAGGVTVLVRDSSDSKDRYYTEII